MEPVNSLLTSQIAAAAACSYILNLLQKSPKLPWITAHSAGINTAIRIVLSGMATLGITYAWAPSMGGGHTLTFTIPSGAAVIAAGWHWFSQFALTHLAGTALEEKPAPAPPAPPAPIPAPAPNPNP